MVAVTRCSSKELVVDGNVRCYSAVHITLIVLSVLMIAMAGVVVAGCSFYYQSTELSQNDALSL